MKEKRTLDEKIAARKYRDYERERKAPPTSKSKWRWCFSCANRKALVCKNLCENCDIRLKSYFKYCSLCDEKHVIKCPNESIPGSK